MGTGFHLCVFPQSNNNNIKKGYEAGQAQHRVLEGERCFHTWGKTTTTKKKTPKQKWKLKSASCVHCAALARFSCSRAWERFDENIKHKRTFWFKSCLNINGEVWGCESCCLNAFVPCLQRLRRDTSAHVKMRRKRKEKKRFFFLSSTAWRSVWARRVPVEVCYTGK